MYSVIGISVENESKVLKGKHFPACYIKVNYPRILVDFMPVKSNNKTMMMLFLVGYLGL